jgi:hypothetical protein
MEIRPDVGTALAAGRAGELRLKIRQPNIIWPSIAADSDVMAAPTASCSSVMDHALAVKSGDYFDFPTVSPAKKAILPSGRWGA